MICRLICLRFQLRLAHGKQTPKLLGYLAERAGEREVESVKTGVKRTSPPMEPQGAGAIYIGLWPDRTEG